MTTITETILSAMDDTPRGRAEIAEATGLEPQAVSVELSNMKHRGLVERADGGWIVASGDTPKRATHAAREAAGGDEPEPPKRRGRRPRALPIYPAPVAPHNGDGRTVEFAIAESGSILLRAHGQTDDWFELSPADAKALAALVNR
jgi:hypothetical protein